MKHQQYCCALFFIRTKYFYYSFTNALVKFHYVSVKFIYGFFLSLQVPTAQKIASELAFTINLTVSSARRPYTAGNWKAA